MNLGRDYSWHESPPCYLTASRTRMNFRQIGCRNGIRDGIGRNPKIEIDFSATTARLLLRGAIFNRDKHP